MIETRKLKNYINRFKSMCDMLESESDVLQFVIKEPVYIGKQKTVRNIAMERVNNNELLSFDLQYESHTSNHDAIREIGKCFCDVEFKALSPIDLPNTDILERYAGRSKVGYTQGCNHVARVELINLKG